jgi:hypothetical protein
MPFGFYNLVVETMDACPCCELVYDGDLRPFVLSCGHVVCKECRQAMMVCQPAACLICGWLLDQTPSNGSAPPADVLLTFDECVAILDNASQRCTERCLVQAGKTARIPLNRTLTRCKLYEDAAGFRALLAKHYAGVDADIDAVAMQWMEEARAMEASLLSLRSRIVETLDAADKGASVDAFERNRICARIKIETTDWKEHARVLPAMREPRKFAEAAKAVIDGMKPLPMDLLGGSVEASGTGCFGFHYGHASDADANEIILQYKNAAGERACWLQPSDFSVAFSNETAAALVSIKMCGVGVAKVVYSVSDQTVDDLEITVRAKNLVRVLTPRSGKIYHQNIGTVTIPAGLAGAFWTMQVSQDGSRAVCFGMLQSAFLKQRGNEFGATWFLPRDRNAGAFLTNDTVLLIARENINVMEIRALDGTVTGTIAVEPVIKVTEIDVSGGLIAACCWWRPGVLVMLHAETHVELQRVVFENHDICAICVSRDETCVYVVLHGGISFKATTISLVRVGLDGSTTTLYVERHENGAGRNLNLLRWNNDVIWTKDSSCQMFCGQSGVKLRRWSVDGSLVSASDKHLYIKNVKKPVNKMSLMN